MSLNVECAYKIKIIYHYYLYLEDFESVQLLTLIIVTANVIWFLGPREVPTAVP
jgi:hypothetical protein